MTILSQKGLFTAYLDIKLTVANTNADDVGRWQTPNWYITSNGHVNKCSRVTAVHFSFPLFLKTISPIQKCQLFKVDFHKHICVRFYHGSSESEKCSLAGFSSLKKIRKAIPKSNQRRVNEKQLHRQNPGDWILEQRGEKVQSMTCSMKRPFYLCICKQGWGLWEHTAWQSGLSRVQTSPGSGPEGSIKKMVRLCNDS